MDNKRILVIEDDDDLRETIGAVLARAGYTVDGFANGLQAVEHLKNPAHAPDGMLIDLAMPVFDGFDFLSHRSMHRELAQVPAILMTGHSERTVVNDLRGRFALEILRKPIQMDALLELVGRCTGGPKRAKRGSRKASTRKPAAPAKGRPRAAH